MCPKRDIGRTLAGVHDFTSTTTRCIVLLKSDVVFEIPKPFSSRTGEVTLLFLAFRVHT